jgi:hypothetical protein
MIPVTITSSPAVVHTLFPSSRWRTGFLSNLFNDDQLRIVDWKYVNDVLKRIWNEKAVANFMELAGADKNQKSSEDGRLIGQESYSDRSMRVCEF